MNQIINEPTNVINNSFSCIDLIFCNQPNLITSSGVHSSLHPNCHHHITHAKLDLKVYYPPPYKRTIWHYNEANPDHIRRSIEFFNWDNAFHNCDINDQVALFNRTILNIMKNFIPQEQRTYDDKDPPWINLGIKMLIKEKDDIFHKLLKDPHNNLLR